MENSETFQISHHALARLKERWEILKRRPLEEGDVLPKLQELILKSKPEPGNPAILNRKKRYGVGHRYMISGRWRLIWQDNRLITVELRKLGVFSKPKLYPGEVRASFFLKVTEQKDSTLIEKFVFKNPGGPATLNLSSKPEVNAIIRLLRLCGADVGYKRTGQESQKQAVITVLLPKELRKFSTSRLEERKIELSFFNQEKPCSIFGITYEACLEIINFFADQEWLDYIQLAKETARLDRQKRAEARHKAKSQRREQQEEQQRINIEKKIRLAAEKDKREKTEKERDENRENSKIQAFILLLSETLDVSTDYDTVLRELIKRFPQKIQKDEHKLGNTWLLNYRFAAKGISVSIIIRDAPTREIGRKEIAARMIPQLKNLIKSTP